MPERDLNARSRRQDYLHDLALLVTLLIFGALWYLALWGLTSLVGVFDRHHWHSLALFTAFFALGWCLTALWAVGVMAWREVRRSRERRARG